MSDAKDRLIATIRAEQQAWRTLVEEVGKDRMTQPGPMGDWSFRDLAVHLTGWRDRTIRRLEAAGRGEPEPANPWPAELEDDDSINDWINERGRDRSVDDVLAEIDASHDRLAAAIAALPDDALTDPDAFPWLGGEPIAAVDFFSHVHDEHEPTIRAWLASSAAR